LRYQRWSLSVAIGTYLYFSSAAKPISVAAVKLKQRSHLVTPFCLLRVRRNTPQDCRWARSNGRVAWIGVERVTGYSKVSCWFARDNDYSVQSNQARANLAAARPGSINWFRFAPQEKLKDKAGVFALRQH